MKLHTPQFKEEIKKFGRQLDSKITYQLNGETVELGSEDINAITPTFQADILKSAMKQLDIDSNVDIPLGTILKYQFGVLVNEEYEYLDYGNYIVYSSEKQEDTKSYKIICYDVMLYAMTDYNELQTGTFPITVKEYLECLCHDISLEFANSIGTFTNYDKIIPSDLYANLGYTYRDIFDELAQVTASTICINNNNQVEVRYIQKNEYEEKIVEGGNDLYLENSNGNNAIEYHIDGKSEQENNPSPDDPSEIKTIGGASLKIKTTSASGTEQITTIDMQGYELNSLGDIKDEFDFSLGQITLTKRIGKKILTSNDILEKRNDGDGSKTITFNLIPSIVGNIKYIGTSSIKSNRFVYEQSSMSGKEGIGLGLDSSSKPNIMYIQINRNKLSTLDVNGMKAWLDNNQTILYYVLETPEIINLSFTNIPLFEGNNTVSLMSTVETNTKIKYQTTNVINDIDTIDEEYLKDINVNFGEKYGPINSIVLSRAGGSDNVYLQDEKSIEKNGLHELKISDNQIMNGNNRSDYLPGILSQLNGLEYHINDFVSTGICYYDICDRYNVKIGDNTYYCIMFNDEINITQGLVENIHTDMPEESQTDYTKADKTDRRINETYLIVDKQNQQIEGVISQTTEQNNKIARISATVDELNVKISDIADITVSGETSYATLQLNNINQSEPIYLKVRPIIENISYLYPNNSLFPSNDIYPGKTRTIRFENIKTNEIFDYELEQDLLFFDGNTYDTFELSYDGQTCRIVKRCDYDNNGNVIKLDQEEVFDYNYPQILLTDGDYEVSILGYNTGYIYTTLMASNIYTTQFATRTEVSSQLKQTSTQILSEVDAKFILTDDEITQLNSKIDQTAGSINLEVSKKVGNNEIISRINQTPEQIQINASKISLKGKEINLTSDNTIIKSNNFNVDRYGNLSCNNANLNGSYLRIGSEYYTNPQFFIGNNNDTQLSNGHIDFNDTSKNCRIIISTKTADSNGTPIPQLYLKSNGTGHDTWITSETVQTPVVEADTIYYGRLIPYSVVEKKKNFEKLNNGLDIIKNTDIYKYNYKDEKDDYKKHIGFIIGKDYKYSKELTGELNGKETGADIYSMVSVCFKAIQEQQEIIENLQNQINELKEMINNGDK